MDPLTLTTSCVGLIAAAAQLTVQVNGFVGTFKGAHSDMRNVLEDLSVLTLTLQALREGDVGHHFPAPMLEALLAVLRYCDQVLKEMRTLLQQLASPRSTRLKWSMGGGQEDMGKLRTRLDSYKMTIMISLQVGSIATNGPDIARVLDATSSLSRRLETGDHRGYSLPLQRFLAESVAYAGSVVEPEDFVSMVGARAVEDTIVENNNAPESRSQLATRDHIGDSQLRKNPVHEPVAYAEPVSDLEELVPTQLVGPVADTATEAYKNDHAPHEIGNGILTHGPLFTLRGHSKQIRDLILSHDGAVLVSQSYESVAGIQLWDMDTGTLRATISSGTVDGLSLSRDGSTLAGFSRTSGDQGWSEYSFCLWNVQGGISIKSTWRQLSVLRLVSKAAFGPDDKSLAYVCRNGAVGLADVKTGVCWDLCPPELPDELDYMSTIQFSTSGRFLAGYARTNTVRLWDLTDGNKCSILHTSRAPIVYKSNVAFSPDERYLASAGEAEIVRLWNVHRGTLHAQLHGHAEVINLLRFLDDGATLIAVDWCGTAKIWDVQTGHEKYSFKGQDLYSSSISPSRSLIAGGPDFETGDGDIFLRRVTMGKVIAVFTGFKSLVSMLQFDKSGRRLVSGHGDGSIRIWDTALNPELRNGVISRERLAEVERPD